MAKTFQINVTTLPDDADAIHELWLKLDGLTNDLYIDYRDENIVIVKSKIIGDILRICKFNNL